MSSLLCFAHSIHARFIYRFAVDPRFVLLLPYLSLFNYSQLFPVDPNHRLSPAPFRLAQTTKTDPCSRAAVQPLRQISSNRVLFSLLAWVHRAFVREGNLCSQKGSRTTSGWGEATDEGEGELLKMWRNVLNVVLTGVHPVVFLSNFHHLSPPSLSRSKTHQKYTCIPVTSPQAHFIKNSKMQSDSTREVWPRIARGTSARPPIPH